MLGSSKNLNLFIFIRINLTGSLSNLDKTMSRLEQVCCRKIPKLIRHYDLWSVMPYTVQWPTVHCFCRPILWLASFSSMSLARSASLSLMLVDSMRRSSSSVRLWRNSVLNSFNNGNFSRNTLRSSGFIRLECGAPGSGKRDCVLNRAPIKPAAGCRSAKLWAACKFWAILSLVMPAGIPWIICDWFIFHFRFYISLT